MQRKVLFFRFQHETNAICPAPADMTAYKNACFLIGQEALNLPRDARMDGTGVLNVLEAQEDIQIIPVLNMFANPSGPVTEEVLIS